MVSGLRIPSALLLVGSLCACGTSPGSSGSTGGGTPCSLGSPVQMPPACANPPAMALTVPKGCTPKVDGTYDQGEWEDAACVSVGMDTVYVKYSGTSLYLAWPLSSAFGCPAQLAFNTDGSQTLDGNQLDLCIFDAPTNDMGDSGEFLSEGGVWNAQTVATDILVAAPPQATPVVSYELAIPFSHLGLTAGTVGTLGMGLVHSTLGSWPGGLSVPGNSCQPSNPSEWGQLSSSAKWQ